jgi:hypothetical protein
MNYRRIKYISRFADDLDSSGLEAISEASRRNNVELGVTGILVASGGVFMQILEGPPESVAQLWARISADDRHQEVLLLVDEPTDRLLFPDWAMKTIDLSASKGRLEEVHSMLDSIRTHRDQIDSLVNAIERAIWDELVESEEVPGA